MLSAQEARHAFAFGVHFTAFWFLLGFALAEDPDLSVYKTQFWWVRDKFALSPRRWYFQCINATNQLDPSLLSCADRDKRFYVKRDPGESITHINVLVLACLYVMWSALGHLLAVFMIERQRVLRWLDYAVTAPTMLVVLSVAFGADSFTAVVLAPCVLAVLLVIAGILEPNWSVASVKRYKTKRVAVKPASKADEATKAPTAGLGNLSYYRQATIATLFLTYVPVVVPVLYASYDITVDKEPGTGTAPDFVFAFSVVVVLLFTSFAGLYLWDMVWPMYPDRRERGYIFLSMVSKTSLHLFLGLAVIGQSNGVGVDEPRLEEDNMDTLAIGLGGTAGLVIGLGLLNYYFDRIFCYAAESGDAKDGYVLVTLSEMFL